MGSKDPILNKDPAPKKLSTKQINKYIDGIYDGKITADNLSEEVYESIVSFLKAGLYKGFGQTLEEAEGKDLDLLTELRENIYHFSAAKNYQMTKEINSLLTDEEGNIRTNAEFNALARSTFDNWNDNYGSTEYETAIASGQMGAKWNDIEEKKDVLPYLKLSVVEDDNTSEICEPLDEICLPIVDPFWNIYYPPNHFRCRTTVLQLDEGDGSAQESPDSRVEKGTEHADEHMQDMFKMNCGKEGIVFSKEHPYFDVPAADRKFAMRNFDMPVPDND